MITLHTNGSVFRLDVVYHNSRHNNSDDIDNERSYGNEYINQSLHNSGFDVVLGSKFTWLENESAGKVDIT
jgi:hypothetical protein